MKLKKIIQESAYLGELPSSKLMKMKWNPLTEEEDVADQDHKGSTDDLPPQDMGLEEAPKMRKDPYVEKMRELRTQIERMENQMKAADSSRYSHLKGAFNKAYKGVAELTNTLNRKGSTIPS
tara:strand:+ start:65 stop:430 length:366 start_codon:yes stop_codon:yes gene_type:complete